MLTADLKMYIVINLEKRTILQSNHTTYKYLISMQHIKLLLDVNEKSHEMQQYEQGQYRTLVDLMALLSAGIGLLDWLERWWGWPVIYLWGENDMVVKSHQLIFSINWKYV